MLEKTWGWAGSVGQFLTASDAEIVGSLTSHHLACMGQQPSGSQIDAWLDTLSTLRDALPQCANAAAWTLVFEYELPRERGRRPDVVILSGSGILVLEFKQQPSPDRAFIDQVDAYARDLAEYHEGSHGREVTPVLVFGAPSPFRSRAGRVLLVSPELVADVLDEIVSNSPASQIDPMEWLLSDYAPLPTLVEAARTIFRHEPLPRVRRANSLGVNEAALELGRIAMEARDTSGMHLALVTGVPGAGKTLVGLKFVYESRFSDSDGQEAIFLSGNGPLVNVLQYTLSAEGKEGRVFVRDVHGFLKRYGGMAERVPHEHVWVYDEAQRAWDKARVTEKPGRSDFSEPEDFLRIGLKHGDWSLMVGLIGEGQEIHRGEESGLGQWNLAIQETNSEWTVHCPARLADHFSAAAAIVENDSLDLDRSLRSHTAERLHEWVAALLSGDASQASALGRVLSNDAFDMLVTRDLEAARLYVRKRYEEDETARYGLLVSSQGKLESYGFVDDFYLKPGPWFNEGQESPHSCCALSTAVTEFQCQGLELDMPIIGWGTDYAWTGAKWAIRPRVRRTVRDPMHITANAYRVLLTRGRDGFVIFVPPLPELDAVHRLLVDSGCDELSRIWL